MSMTVSVRVEHKSSQKAATQRRHNERLGSQPKYIDATRSELNSVLIHAPKEAELRDRCELYKSQRQTKRATKVDAAVLTDGIITFGTEAQKVIETLSVEAQNDYFLRAAEAISKQLNSDLVALSVHRDESAIHAHFGLLAVNKTGHPNSKVLTPSATSRLQDLVGEVYEDLCISRGTHKGTRIARGDDASKIVHRSVKQLHEDLPKELAQAKWQNQEMIDYYDDVEKHYAQQVQEQKEKLAKNTRLAEKAKADLEKATSDLAKVEKRLATYERRCEDAKQTLHELLGKQFDVALKVATDYQFLFDQKQRLEAEYNDHPAPALAQKIELTEKLWKFATQNSPALQQSRGQEMMR